MGKRAILSVSNECSITPFGVMLRRRVLPVVSLADSLYHRLQLLQAFGLLNSQGPVPGRRLTKLPGTGLQMENTEEDLRHW